METLTVKKVNEVYMTIDCDGGSCFELSDYFTFTVPGMQFMPAVRNKFWDGKIRLFNAQTKKIYSGLLPHVQKFCDERDYNLEIDPAYADDEFSLQEAKLFASTLDLPFDILLLLYKSLNFNSPRLFFRFLIIVEFVQENSLIIYILKTIMTLH